MNKRSCLSVLLSVSFLLISSTAYSEDMIRMKGAYGASSGFEVDDYIWKDANADYQEKNWRYVFGPDTVNTYDKRIFDRYELDIQTTTGTPWNAGCLIKVDPWSFVGVGHEKISNRWGDECEIDYKYWEATGKTINQSYRTLFSNVLRSPEQGVVGHQVVAAPAVPQEVWNPVEPNFQDFSRGKNVKIDYMFRGIRKVWVEYKETPLYVKVFPISDMHEALYSDDPLRLSNNKVYWAPSPWLWRFEPGLTLASTPRSVQPAKWNWDEAWYAEDTNRNYLTFLRGFTVGYKFHNLATIDATVASPMGLWDYYDDVNSIPMAVRFKMYPSNNLKIGSTYTARYGVNKQELRGNNQVIGADFDYNFGEDTHLFGETAVSSLFLKSNDIQQTDNRGYAYKIGFKSKIDGTNHGFAWDANVTEMSQHFAPGLADYRDTRIDRDWGQHIWFDPIPKEDAAIRIGDSVDINRFVVGANASAQFSDNLVNLYLNLRNVHNSYNHKFIENIGRVEATYNPLSNLQFKGLALYRQRPPTVARQDPWLYDRYLDIPYRNDQMCDGQNADIMTLSGGAKVEFFDKKLTLFGIYERTNDPQDFPRREINYPYNYMYGANNTLSNDRDNILMNDVSNTLYGQWLWNMPEMPYYNILKGVVIVQPVERLSIRYTHVTNGNKNYASLLDDNHNHDGIDVTYTVFKKLTVQAGYSLSRVIDINRALDTNGRERLFKYHNNVYAQAKYDITRDHNFIAQFGEFGLLERNLGIFGQTDPGMGYLNSRQGVLDTRCILRLFYQGKF